jgi:hypothetical protein
LGAPSYFVYIPPFAGQDPELAATLSKRLGLTMIDAKMLLAARAPRKVGAYETREEADRSISEFRSMGLHAFIVEKDEFASKAFVIRGKGLEFRVGACAFRPIEIAGPSPDLRAGDPEMVLPQGHVKAIVAGLFTHRKQKASVDEHGAIDVSSRDDSEPFVHLYWGSASGLLEIRQGEFHYGCIDAPARAASSRLNFQFVAEALRRFFSPAPYLDLLLKNPNEADQMVAALPVDWSKGPLMLGAVTAQKSSSDEGIQVTASRILARSVMG